MNVCGACKMCEKQLKPADLNNLPKVVFACLKLGGNLTVPTIVAAHISTLAAAILTRYCLGRLSSTCFGRRHCVA
jgi:hypothetical protein